MLPSSRSSFYREATALRIGNPFVIGADNNPTPEDHFEGLVVDPIAEQVTPIATLPLVAGYIFLPINGRERPQTLGSGR